MLKPGGIVHCCELIDDSSFVYPTNKTLDRGWDAFAVVLESDDGHPQMGKEVYAHLCEAGFTDIRVSGAFYTYSAADELERFYKLVTGWFLDVEMTSAAKSYGAATEEDLSLLSQAMKKWKEQPGPMPPSLTAWPLASAPDSAARGLETALRPPH